MRKTSGLKLYRLSQQVNNNYDTYDSCVVCAPSKKTAKTIAPDGKHMDWHRRKFGIGTWASDVSDVKCEYIGKAFKDIEEGVVVASFNAG